MKCHIVPSEWWYMFSTLPCRFSVLTLRLGEASNMVSSSYCYVFITSTCPFSVRGELNERTLIVQRHADMSHRAHRFAWGVMSGVFSLVSHVYHKGLAVDGKNTLIVFTLTRFPSQRLMSSLFEHWGLCGWGVWLGVFGMEIHLHLYWRPQYTKRNKKSKRIPMQMTFVSIHPWILYLLIRFEFYTRRIQELFTDNTAESAMVGETFHNSRVTPERKPAWAGNER